MTESSIDLESLIGKAAFGSVNKETDDRTPTVNLRPLLLLLLLLNLLHGMAASSTAEAEKRLQTAVNEVLKIADRAPTNSALAESLRPVLVKYISFDAMTRRAIGPGMAPIHAGSAKEGD